MGAERLTVRVPGKLMVAGEYAVLEPHKPSVVVGVDRYMTASIRLAPEHGLSVPAWGLVDAPFQDLHDRIRFHDRDPRLKFVSEAMAVALGYLREQFLLTLPFHLTIESELESEGRKIGLGSSAAVVVATVAAVLHLLGDDDVGPDAETIFKLSAIAHLRGQGSGSGADVAASTYGGWIEYRSFQPEWLLERLDRKPPLYRLLTEPWPFLAIEPFEPPPELVLCVGWTGQPASTSELIERVRALRDRDPVAYGTFLKESREAVEAFVLAMRQGAGPQAIAELEHNRRALATLGAHSGAMIETPALYELHRWAELCGGGGKPSGAGGGDCGVALIAGRDRAESLHAAWSKAGIAPLRLAVSEAGVEVTEG